jgi:hypothetical protein
MKRLWLIEAASICGSDIGIVKFEATPREH